MEEPIIVRDDAGIEWLQRHDPLSNRTVLERITPHPRATRSTRPLQTVRVIERDPPQVPAAPPGDESRERTAYKYLLAASPNSAADAAERLRTVMTQLTPGEIQRAVDAYVKARLS